METVPDARQWDLETEFAEGNAFIQWKGTDVCMDFRCDCGVDAHFDGYFAYVVKCTSCGQEWQMPTMVFPRKRCAETPASHEPVLLTDHD